MVAGMYKDDLLHILLTQQVLLFGDFLTKSGRRSPYFFNTGRINNGAALSTVAKVYAEAIMQEFPDDLENLFGPAYKGIPLACATAMSLSQAFGRTVSYTYNRKEQKAHGERGMLVGYEYDAPTNCLIIEDVLTAGTSLRDSIDLLKPYPVRLKGALVGIDRQERGTGGASARAELEADYHLPVRSILDLDAIVERLWNRRVLGRIWIDDSMKAKIDEYRQTHAAN